MSLNKVILIGNLGQDPEVRYTNSQTAVVRLNIATSERRKSGDEWKDHTEWHTVVAFGKQAENCGEFLQKGRQVSIEGRLQTNKWQDKEGNDRYTTEIIADNIIFLGKGNGERTERSNDGGRGSGRGGSAPRGGAARGNAHTNRSSSVHQETDEDGGGMPY